jgi:hypothetical protein
MRANRRQQILALACWGVVLPGAAHAQSDDGNAAQTSTTQSAWSARASAAVYLLPDDDDYLQPTVTADRAQLHLEARYNYEDRISVSAFAGWNIEFGKTFTVQLTPMFGVVAGDTDGVMPALELDLAWRRLEFYSEGEVVVHFEGRRNSFLYNWSEGSVWLAGWLRAGVVTQRTRVYQTPRETQRGLIVGGAVSRAEWAMYLFNPGSDDSFLVTSFSLTF